VAEFPDITGFTCDAVLGRGGMAVVYSAVDQTLGRRVAIKVVSASDSDEAQHVRRLEQEARGLANLQHPHIVELHSFGRTKDGALYYVMPRLDGGDLSSRPKPLGEQRLRDMLDALLGALAHAHASGIVHRDIKPGNILFDRYDRPLLADFGAAFVRGAQRITDGDMAIGSTDYMSPEQARGLEVDARSDLYSLGVLAFEYLTGRLPFEGEDDLAIALAKEEQPVPRLRPQLAHWQRFIDGALASRRAARFPDAEAMRAALPAVATAPEAPSKPAGRRAATIAGAALLLALAVAYALWPRAEAPAPAAPVASVAVATPTPSLGEIVGAPPVPPEASPTPSRRPSGGDASLVSAGGLSLMREPVDAATYRRFLVATDRVVFDCPEAPGGAQGCIGVPQAEQFAAWLSRETGASYRLPTREELQRAVPKLSPLAARAWTSTCEERRVTQQQNVARRAWSGVRQVFGRDRLRGRTTVQCVGNYAVALDGSGKDAVALERAGPNTVVVLVRDPPGG
jgi:formylglycine-generating enzyme required for sulfatase activity